MSFKQRLFPGVFLCVALWIFSLSSIACAGKLVYIFDASGSMWGQIDGVAKIEIAKQALSELVKKIPANMDVGLYAYGHNRKGDCADIEELVPLEQMDTSALMGAVKGITPKGKTPMADSIQLVAEKIKHYEDETTIILISDGKETCNPAPCAVVEELKKLGINFTLHVIGFDVGGETEEQLRCMAKAGGGDYFSAKNAKDFQQAAQGALDKVTVNLKVSAKRDGKNIKVDVLISDASGKMVANRVATDKAAAGFSLPPGSYTVRVVDEWGQEGKPEKTINNVQISETEVQEITATFGGGALELATLKNGKQFSADITITDSNGKNTYKQSADDASTIIKLPAGSYTVTVKDEWGTGAIVDLGSVEITSGTVKKVATFESGTFHVWAHKGGKPYVVDVFVIDAQGTQVENKTTRENEAVKFELAPGDYTIRLKDEWGNGSVQEASATITANETIEIKKDF